MHRECFERAMTDPCAVLLRPARLADAVAMAQMSRELIETGLAWRYTPARMGALVTERETVALGAYDGTRIAGFAVMQFGDANAHLALLCVRPSHRRRGIARRLVQWLVASARVAGMESIRLELRSDNPAAFGLYRGLGFLETQLAPDYYDGRIAARRMAFALRDVPPP